MSDIFRTELVLVPLDKDFGELAVAFGRPHAGIIRIVNFPISRHTAVCLRALEQHGDELARGAIVTAERGRLRMRPAPQNISPEWGTIAAARNTRGRKPVFNRRILY